MDVHVPGAITTALRLRGIAVLTAQADGRARLSDPSMLDRAGELRRILVSQDHDLLPGASRRQREGNGFAGAVFTHQLRVPVGVAIEGQEILAKAGAPDDFRNQVFDLPLEDESAT